MMFSFFKRQENFDREQKFQTKFIELDEGIKKLAFDMKQMREEFEKLEIKALESRKIYAKKLKNFDKSLEESEEMQTTQSVILPDTR